MKQYCLISKNKFDQLFQNQSTGGKKARLTPLKAVRTAKFRAKTLRKVSKPPSQTELPNLDHIIDIKFPLNHKHYITSFLNLLKSSNTTSWDENGQLTKPIQGYNIIHILEKLFINKSLLEVKDIPFYRLLLKTSGIPLEFIKNEKAKTQLRNIDPIVKKTKTKWRSY